MPRLNCSIETWFPSIILISYKLDECQELIKTFQWPVWVLNIIIIAPNIFSSYTNCFIESTHGIITWSDLEGQMVHCVIERAPLCLWSSLFPKTYLQLFFHFCACVANRKVRSVISDPNFILTALLIFLS